MDIGLWYVFVVFLMFPGFLAQVAVTLGLAGCVLGTSLLIIFGRFLFVSLQVLGSGLCAVPIRGRCSPGCKVTRGPGV